MRAYALVPWVCVFAAVFAVPRNALGEPFSKLSLRHSSMGVLGCRCSRLHIALYDCQTSASSRMSVCIFILLPDNVAKTVTIKHREYPASDMGTKKNTQKKG